MRRIRLLELQPWPRTGAELLAWCAYPSEREKRERFFRHAMAGYYKAIGIDARRLPLELKGKRNNAINNTVSRGIWLIQERRFRAAYLALWELDGGANNPRGRWPGKAAARKALMTAIAESRTAFKTYCFDDENYQRRVVSESRPVVAISLALLRANTPPGPQAERLLDVMIDETLCADCVAMAAHWAMLLDDPANPRIAVPTIRTTE